jgi:hypothetical protein
LIWNLIAFIIILLCHASLVVSVIYALARGANEDDVIDLLQNGLFAASLFVHYILVLVFRSAALAISPQIWHRFARSTGAVVIIVMGAMVIDQASLISFYGYELDALHAKHWLYSCAFVYFASLTHCTTAVFLLADIQKHYSQLDDFVHLVIQGAQASEVIDAYSPLHNNVAATGLRWHLWLLIAAMLDGACALAIVCVIIRQPDITNPGSGSVFNVWMSLLLSVVFLVAKVWPIASWNDEVEKARLSITEKMDRVNHVAALIANQKLTEQPCTLRVVGIAHLTRGRVCTAALGALLSPMMGFVSKVALNWLERK